MQKFLVSRNVDGMLVYNLIRADNMVMAATVARTKGGTIVRVIPL